MRFVMPEIKVAGPYPIGTACNRDLASKISNSAYKTKFIVKNGDKFDFSLSAADNIENKIYMCGRQKLKLNPLFPQPTLTQKLIQ
ncbi:hypothetical protein midi_00790 [Candidatus Midichloria mitochondrii IricVA]|uniref:Uncharacterized protein n=1 Tax=Midichloria mitochondrii (strain IricVA) TaxID=696127 RepID=F7XWN1_MIDMI|nr:hypothetical protein midi_00790 [Candidatus Midichloria mitochondrii IricVA]